RKNCRMSPGLSRLYQLQPDPYDNTQKATIRVCLFTEVTNAVELREKVRSGEIDAALIRPELVYGVYVLLAAANRAVHQMAHNRMATRSLSAELIYSLSPSRNISDSLVTFGVAEKSTCLLAAVFDDKSGSAMKKLCKQINGKPVDMGSMNEIIDVKKVRKIYQLTDAHYSDDSLSDHIASRLVYKDFSS
ncbi:hypothetical protein PFISCL1PPCAC_17320, partial [Pristionchus fissidentatus]